MKLLDRMIGKDRRARGRFLRVLAQIEDTPPLRYRQGSPAIVSMVAKDDVWSYILTIKSIARTIDQFHIVCIIDRDTPDEARGFLASHLGAIELVHLEDINPSPCQRGGTWERLVYCLDRSRQEYVIQIDSDCLASGRIDEVVHCIAANTSFVLSNAGQPVRSMTDWAEDARRRESTYIGIRAERLLDRLPERQGKRYIRASSGFCGYARCGFDRTHLDSFHRGMERLMGAEWSKWGTEQNGSNFALANSKSIAVLPYPRYANFWPQLDPNESSFLHFFGTHRYHGDVYLSRAKSLIERLID